jgi:glycerol-3-phosphate O-acyltransferase
MLQHQVSLPLWALLLLLAFAGRAVSAILPVVPVAVVAEVLRNAGRNLTELELKAGAHDLVTDLEDRGVAIHVPRRDREYAITVGLRMLTLRRIVIVRQGLLEIAEGQERALAYYANSITHHFTETAAGSSTPALSA